MGLDGVGKGGVFSGKFVGVFLYLIIVSVFFVFKGGLIWGICVRFILL